MRLVQKKSHSINRGMADILQAIAAEISEDIGTSYRDFDAIDVALRTGKSPMIYQKPYDMTRLMPIARGIAQQAVSSMMQWIEASYSFQNIILVGAGHSCSRKRSRRRFPSIRSMKSRIQCMPTSRGFRSLG